MAGRKLNIQTRVRASSILEVVISMVIIVLVFGIAMMIYTNVSRLSLSVKKIRAQALLRETLIRAEQIPYQANRSLTIGDFRIEQEVNPFEADTSLNQIHLTAYDANQQKIAELKKIIFKHE